MSVRLFIENEEIELNESVQFAITKQFEDINNPTTIINDWSKTVSIPFSQKNNKIFGHIYEEDRLISERVVPTDLMKILKHTPYDEWYTVPPLWDAKTGTMTSTRTTNTNPNSNLFVLDGWKGSTYISDILVKDSLGVGSVTFTYNPDVFNRIRVKFNGNNVDTGFYLELGGLTIGNRYTFSFNVTELDRTNTGNDAQVTHLVLVEGSTAVTWDDIYAKPLTGIYFNPYRKLDFRLLWDDNVVMTGYAKMNEIKQVSGKGSYEMTLFGELGKLFQEMKKITFDGTSEDTDYIIDGSQYVEEYINRTLVASSWNSDGQSTTTLKQKGESGYNVTDIIGFTPNNSFSDGFDYKTVQRSLTESDTFTNILGDTFTTDTGVEPDTAIPDGLLPREIGEYRSYLQLPFIYFNKLFQIFQAKVEEVTGYKFDLDTVNWFNDRNPYWSKLVYMLKSFASKNGEAVTNTYEEAGGEESPLVPSFQYSTLYPIPYDGNWTKVFNKPLVDLAHNESKTIYNSSDATFTLPTNTHTTVNSFVVRGGVCLTNVPSSTSVTNMRFNNANAVLVNVKLTGENGRVVYKKGVVYANNTTDSAIINLANNADAKAAIPTTYSYRESLDSGRYCYVWSFSLSFPSQELKRFEFGDYVEIDVETGMYSNANAISPLPLGINFYTAVGFNIDAEFTLNSNYFKSNSIFILNDLWNNEFNLFEQILNYCKLYRICIYVDEFNKKIVFTPFKSFFSNYTIEDWTNKVDKSKDYKITPITFEDKHILFNYEDSETQLGKEYKEKYGVNYGEYRLNTEYNFNDETNELFENNTTSILFTDSVLSWTNLYDYHNISYSLPAETSVYNRDKDNKEVSVFGSYYFHSGKSNFDTQASLRLRPVRITDDTQLQISTNTYYYSQAYNYIIVNTYPRLEIQYTTSNLKNNLCLYNTPKENYTYLPFINFRGMNSIYTNFWDMYISERYNIQNKKITCYVDIKPFDWTNFNFNHFVKIGNQLCIVNKIYDYDISTDETTKVDLITIQSINGYTMDKYEFQRIIG